MILEHATFQLVIASMLGVICLILSVQNLTRLVAVVRNPDIDHRGDRIVGIITGLSIVVIGVIGLIRFYSH